MLNFDILILLLLVSVALYAFVLLIKKLIERVDIWVSDASRGVMLDMAHLKKSSGEGAGFDVLLMSDNKQIIGKLVVSDEKGWVYMPKQADSYSSDKSSFRKSGYVDTQGYIYLIRKGQDPERIGFMAKPSKPNEPTIIGERSWKDLWWKSRLNVYLGDPETFVAPEITEAPSVESVAKPADKTDGQPKEKTGPKISVSGNSQGEQDDNAVMNLSFAAKPKKKVAAEVETDEAMVETPAVEEVAVVGPVEEEFVADEPLAEETIAEEAVMEVPVIEEPAAEEVVEEPVAEEVVEEPVAEEVVEEPVTDEPVVEEIVVEAPAVEEVAVVESADDEFIDEEPMAEETTVPALAVFSYDLNEQEAAYLQTVKDNHMDIIDQIRQEMVKVEGGSFVMGVDAENLSDTRYEIEGNEGPAHRVTLDTFCIGRYPVTQKIWSAIMGYNNSAQLNDDFPIAPVDWNECMLFVSRINALTGLKFSLPTEAQWEFAARGGNLSNGYIYSGSNIKGNVAWDSQYSPVGKKKPNELGIYDMSGLVREWCSDWYVSKYPAEELYNPYGPDAPEYMDEPRRVVRSPYGNETVTNRKGEMPDNPHGFKSYGFRLACEPHKDLGKKVKPVLVGQGVKSGFLGGSPASCPITDEARGGAYALFHSRYAKNSYSENLGDSPYGWTDTALLTSLVYAVIFLVIYFVNTVVFQMPLLGNDLKAVVVLTAFYPVLWAVVRMVKIQSIESGHSIQPVLDLMNKSVGHRKMDIFFIVLGVLSMAWTFIFYDIDFLPLIAAITIGLAINMFCRRTSEPWVVIDPLKEVKPVDLEDEPDEDTLLPAPEGDTTRDYNWKLDSFYGKEIKAHIAISFNQADIDSQRHRNPFILEKPDLTVADYKNYVSRMLTEVSTDDTMMYHSRYAVQEITKIARKRELSEMDTLQFVLDFIQESLVYELDEESREIALPKEYIRYPDELLFDQHGDCDCKTFLAAVLYYIMGYDVLLMMSKQIGHAAVAISVKDKASEDLMSNKDLEDVTLEINGKRYYYCETTTDGFMIGQIQDGFNVDKFETRIEWSHSEDEED